MVINGYIVDLYDNINSSDVAVLLPTTVIAQY